MGWNSRRRRAYPDDVTYSTARLAVLSAALSLTAMIAAAQTRTAAEPTSSAVFESMQKRGLKLDSRTMPIDMIVVDSAAKQPADN